MIIEYYSNEDNHITRSVLFLGDKGYLLDVNHVAEYDWDQLHSSYLYHKPNPFYTTPVGLELLKIQYPGLREYI